VLVHAPYLVNLGSPTPATYDRSVGSVAQALRLATRIGAVGVVVHTGSSVSDCSQNQGLKRVREGLLPLLDALPDAGPDVLLEPTAGQGRSLCATVDDLEVYLEALDRHPRARVCLDTCHAFAAGHDLAQPGGTTALLDRLVPVAGRARLAAVHADDSVDACGSLRDRHARIGRGRIGLEAFRDPSVRIAGRPSHHVDAARNIPAWSS
jgi:deoxyribonuclease IV